MLRSHPNEDAQRALIVGDGAVAGTLAQSFGAAGFVLREVAPASYGPPDLHDTDVVVAAAADPGINAAVLDAARAAGIVALDAPAAPMYAKMHGYVRTAIPPDDRAAVLREVASLPLEALASLDAARAEHEVEAAHARLRKRDDVPAIAHAVCATRASALAMTQTKTVAARLAERGLASTIVTVTTTGDRVQDRPIAAIGSENVWVKELELALRDGRADYAVHSCKDLPSQLEPDMLLAAISEREDPRDAFCSEKYANFDALPPGALVGTSSLRRRTQLAALRPDLRYEDVRGNVDTRLRKMREGQYDAIVLAMAGLRRLGIGATHTVPFDPGQVVPAVAQGALAIETRVSEAELAARLRAAINDDATERCVTAERAALRALRAGCNAPIGIHARLTGDAMTIDGAYALESGEMLRERLTGTVATLDAAERLGERIAAILEERKRTA
jgi:hydroxymethylbilane synthase